MTVVEVPPTLELDPQVEADVSALLFERFSPGYGAATRGHVASLMAVEHYSAGFYYLKSRVGSGIFNRGSTVLISGCAAGGEMLAARQWGFGEVYGIEVDPIWVTACEKRFAGLPGMHAACYEGLRLPYSDEMFDVVSSLHVVEHAWDPKLYVSELLRVMKPGAYLVLDFPTRYHRRELHTNLPSLEWLPRPLRNAGYHLLASRLSPIANQAKLGYRNIYETNLRQISPAAIRRWARASGYGAEFLDQTTVSPGIVRLLTRRKPDQNG
jgi:SAM-dependent methyltransferase